MKKKKKKTSMSFRIVRESNRIPRRETWFALELRFREWEFEARAQIVAFSKTETTCYNYQTSDYVYP